jgi:hypothetical protein
MKILNSSAAMLELSTLIVFRSEKNQRRETTLFDTCEHNNKKKVV